MACSTSQSIDSSRDYKDLINREALGSQEHTLCTQNKEGLEAHHIYLAKDVGICFQMAAEAAATVVLGYDEAPVGFICCYDGGG